MQTPPELADFAERFTTPPDEELIELEVETRASLARPGMLSGALTGRLLDTLVFLTQPRLVLEIGTFSGYGALSLVRELPLDGQIITLEADPEHAAFARRHLERHERIVLREGDALETIATLDGPFDLVFLDAGKDDYVDLYEAVLPKLAPRGVIVVDNTLFDSVLAFNEHVRDDPRVVQVLLPYGEGVTLLRQA